MRPPLPPTPPSAAQLADRARTAIERWKSRLRAGLQPQTEGTIPDSQSASEAATKLRSELAALEDDIAQTEQRLSQVRAEEQRLEQRAMAAIQASDDRAAKVALEEVMKLAELSASLVADLTVLRATASECHSALNEFEATSR